MQSTESFSMQGLVGIGLRNPDGSRMPARWVYDASSLEWDYTVETDKQNEHYSGARGLEDELDKSKDMSVKLTLGQISDKNAALALAGSVEAVTGATVTDETIGDVEPGDMWGLEFAQVSSLALVDGTAQPLVLDTDYTLNATSGVLKFLTAKTGVKASTYSYASFSIVTALTANAQDMYVLFDGMNTVRGKTTKCRGEVNRIAFSPTDSLALINDSFGSINLTGSAKVDAFRINDPKYGGYARLMLLDPA